MPGSLSEILMYSQSWSPSCAATWRSYEWAGHSVEVLLRIYAKCIDGKDETTKKRISAALRES